MRAGGGDEVLARLAPEVRGTVGFTQETGLHPPTRRCWSWRDEGGNELVWSRALGAGLVAGGGDDLWPVFTRVV